MTGAVFTIGWYSRQIERQEETMKVELATLRKPAAGMAYSPIRDVEYSLERTVTACPHDKCLEPLEFDSKELTGAMYGEGPALLMWCPKCERAICLRENEAATGFTIGLML